MWSQMIICPNTPQTCDINTILLLPLIESEPPQFELLCTFSVKNMVAKTNQTAPRAKWKMEKEVHMFYL